MKIPFNRPFNDSSTSKSVSACLEHGRFSGDGLFTKKCAQEMERLFGSRKVLLTTSCTHALEMGAILADIKEGDEVIMPSYTFVSTANAFVLRGAKIVFVDVRPDTMNIDENLIEDAVTSRTKAIVPVHYAGVSCEMDKIIGIAKRNKLIVIEDAAQGMNSKYKGKYLGTLGELGCYSFHETKNFHCGEGGALLVNDVGYVERSEIIREKGTDRSRFFRGQVDKYTWQDLGSSYLLSDLNAAFLLPQIERADEINSVRLKAWENYYLGLVPLEKNGYLSLPVIPEQCEHNAHMFYFKVENLEVRTALIQYLSEKGINAIFHYVPLHSSPAGLKFGRFSGQDRYTTKDSERLVRLPMFYGLSKSEQDFVIDTLTTFFKKSV